MKQFNSNRKLKKEPVRPMPYPAAPNELYRVGNEVLDDRAKALYFFLYITGCRINEATDFIPSRVSFFDTHIIIRLKTLKARSEFRRYRYVVIPLAKHAKCHESEMWQIVLRYIQQFDNTENPFAHWRNMSEYLARHITLTIEAHIKTSSGNWIDKVITKRFNPHFLRHCRLTHLSDYYDLNINQLADFAGHANINMTARYIKIRDLTKAFLR